MKTSTGKRKNHDMNKIVTVVSITSIPVLSWVVIYQCAAIILFLHAGALDEHPAGGFLVFLHVMLVVGIVVVISCIIGIARNSVMNNKGDQSRSSPQYEQRVEEDS